MFDELDTVVLNRDIKEFGLKKGDIGSIVHIYDEGQALEIEFIAAKGKTVAVLTLIPKDVRLMARNEILHARGFTNLIS